jgi:hypothetical protein
MTLQYLSISTIQVLLNSYYVLPKFSKLLIHSLHSILKDKFHKTSLEARIQD